MWQLETIELFIELEKAYYIISYIIINTLYYY